VGNQGFGEYREFWDVNPGFVDFKDKCLILKFGSYSPKNSKQREKITYIENSPTSSSSSSPLSIYPIKGGAIIGVFMI
jgi:hypothetical protein